ncbi:hypothetical protein KKH38_04640 [Patescibacteria group bacterium]|nr:hypothetical protein [Patescibacteria group bacterium]MBU4600638.1 hypothetical protein [Patescibacteria group bacterium]
MPLKQTVDPAVSLCPESAEELQVLLGAPFQMSDFGCRMSDIQKYGYLNSPRQPKGYEICLIAI